MSGLLFLSPTSGPTRKLLYASTPASVAITKAAPKQNTVIGITINPTVAPVTDLPSADRRSLLSVSQPSATVSQSFAVVSQPFAVASQPFAVVNQLFAVVNQLFAVVNQLFAVVSQPFAVVSQPFSVVSQLFAVASQ